VARGVTEEDLKGKNAFITFADSAEFYATIDKVTVF